MLSGSAVLFGTTVVVKVVVGAAERPRIELLLMVCPRELCDEGEALGRNDVDGVAVLLPVEVPCGDSSRPCLAAADDDDDERVPEPR